MKSTATSDFWELFRQLPQPIQRLAREAYQHFTVDPHYPGLRYHTITVKKRVLHSVSIGIHYRALAQEKDGVLEWFWIGHHTVYDRLLSGR